MNSSIKWNKMVIFFSKCSFSVAYYTCWLSSHQFLIGKNKPPHKIQHSIQHKCFTQLGKMHSNASQLNEMWGMNDSTDGKLVPNYSEHHVHKSAVVVLRILSINISKNISYSKLKNEYSIGKLVIMFLHEF